MRHHHKRYFLKEQVILFRDCRTHAYGWKIQQIKLQEQYSIGILFILWMLHILCRHCCLYIWTHKHFLFLAVDNSNYQQLFFSSNTNGWKSVENYKGSFLLTMFEMKHLDCGESVKPFCGSPTWH